MLPALYLHIPYCAKKCAYCDFASRAGGEGTREAYFGALEKELSGWTALVGHRFSTVFFGGGTPSLVEAERIARLLDGIQAEEISLEANPGTLTPEKLEVYREAGIDRISLGVQSFDDGLLRLLGRIHTASEAEQAYRMVRAAGFRNVNLDLMYALPEQTEEQWETTLCHAAALQPEHISAYSLILEEGTPMARWAVSRDEDTVNRMQRTATRVLGEAGLRRYEISNYARPGFECRHNLNYWRRGDYIGVGSAAHSLFHGVRFRNPDSIESYIAGVRRLDETVLSEEDITEETVMLGLRMAEGIPLDAIPQREKLARLSEAGFLTLRGGSVALTERGMEVQDAVTEELLWK